MICPECKSAGQRSTVQVGYGVTTCMGVSAFYDEDGALHRHDPNTTTTSLSCSNGHRWSVNSEPVCHAPNCTWADKQKARRARIADRIKPATAAETGSVGMKSQSDVMHQNPVAKGEGSE